MQHFEYLNYRIRLTDQRPKNAVIQVNIYNPLDAGHSYASFIQTSEETTTDLSEIFETANNNQTLFNMISNAKITFG